MNRKSLLITAALTVIAALAVVLGIEVSKPTPRTVTMTVTSTVTTRTLLEDRDSDPGDQGGQPESMTAVAPSRTAGAPEIVQIDPSAETGADKGGTHPKGLPASVQSCGVERAAVKHLADGFTLPSSPTIMTVDQLVGMAAPPVTPDSPRLPQEHTLVELQNVHIVAAKQEADSDLHVIIATSTGAEMNVEAPMAVCDSSSPYAAQLAAARAAMDKAFGTVSSLNYTPENVTATVEGILFFDVLHGQRGAPNGVELHPVTLFQVGGGPAPGTTTTATTTTTAPATTIAPTTTAATTTTTSTRDSDYRADPAECAHRPRRDSDARDDKREGCGQ